MTSSDMLAQFRPLLYKFDCNTGRGNRSEGLKPHCYSDFGQIQVETKPSLHSRLVAQGNSSVLVKPNWCDNVSIVPGSAHGSNNRWLARAPSQQG